VQLIFDSKGGNIIHAKGNGNLRIYIPPSSGFTLTGDLTIEQGDYQFALQNMPVKKLQIEPGATLKWTGDVSNAQLDIDAVYRTKASLYDLLQDESNPDLAQRLPVECHLLMTGYLGTPNVDFNIVLPPTSNDIARTQLQNLTKEDLNKQVISLLILNRFTPLQGTSSGTAKGKGYENAGLSTTTEVLSNQLNYWISQISSDFDVGFNYRPGDQLTSDEVEVALSKQFLNNRMTINVNGNYDVRPSTTNTNQLVGDVEVEYKIKQSGKVRVKVFTRANDHLLYEYAPYTQGVGLFYREEFDTFGDLARKYRDKWFRK
ncbi:MAG: translocation/assembly module TamB domain-containing protein, partial [Bacteroidia bacterium]|nr:translocation/assembly module TamB domain-containing protein [Bacteroidia bacterium]